MTNYPDDPGGSSFPPSPQPRRLPLPMSKPFVTLIILGTIIAIFVMMTVAGGSTDPQVLIRFGANFGPLILNGQTWRLFTSMFLHIGLAHLFFNS